VAVLLDASAAVNVPDGAANGKADLRQDAEAIPLDRCGGEADASYFDLQTELCACLRRDRRIWLSVGRPGDLGFGGPPGEWARATWSSAARAGWVEIGGGAVLPPRQIGFGMRSLRSRGPAEAELWRHIPMPQPPRWLENDPRLRGHLRPRQSGSNSV